MAGRSQHRDNRSSYFSSDIGRSGVYDGVNGTPINFSQRGDNPNDLRDTEGISETARESGLYASRIGSTKQPTDDYSKEGMLGSTGNFPRQNWDQSFEEGNRTPESGTYSRNIESNQYDTDYKANNDIGRSSTFDNNRDSGLYSRKIGSFRETIPENSGKDNQRQSSKHFKPNKYIGNTLDTMLEGEDESKQPEHFHSTNYSESRKYSGTARNGDYDGHSNASFQDDKECPPWAGMMVEQQFTDKYIKTKWPRISLHLTQPRHSDPFVPGKIDEGSIDIKSAKDDHKTRNTLCVIGLGTLLLCFVGAAIITVIVLANQSSDKTEYVKVNMTITVEKTFTSELNDPKTTGYKLFASEVCKQTEDVYTSANSTLSGYYGCKVSNLENGSIIVTYIIYFTGSTTQQVTSEAVETILYTHLNVSSSHLGDLKIVTVTVYNVETETLSSPPPVEESVTTTTTVITTPHIETTTEVVVKSTVTTSDSETVQTTEATTLNTKQTTMETTSLTTSSTEATTPKTVQTTTDTVISTVPPTEDTMTEPTQSTMETNTSKVPPTEDTMTETKRSTMVTTTSKVPPTEDTTTETVQSTTAPASPLISSTEETTLKTVQSTGETSNHSVSLTDETTPKTMHSTTKIITPSSSSTENTTPKTMQTETTSPIMISTVESMSSQSTNHVSDVTTTLQTEKTTEATQETTSIKTTPTKESISSTSQEEPTTLTSTITTSSTDALSDTKTSDSTERTKTSGSVPLIDTTQPVISTSTDDTNQLITSTPPEETTRLITSTSIGDTTSKMPSTSKDYTTHAEDTTKPTTSASTEESTTKLITPTSIDDTIKPVTFTSTDDTTATLTSTATVDTTKSVTSTPIEDVTQSETFTSTEKTTKHVTSTPSEDTTKTISSAPTEDTTPSITAISTEDTPTEDTTTKTVSSIITEGTTLSITATSTSMPTTGRTTSDEITTVSGTTTESQNIGLNCTDLLTEVLYSGPVAIVCTIQKSDQFDYIRISHDEGSNNSIYGILLNKDGTTIQNFVENQDINVTINSISTINLVLTFVNVSCAMEGFYKVAIISNMSGEMKESVSRKIQLEVSSPAEKPILTLNADQVIDLIFNNNTNDYFRAEGLHQCEGYVGRPPSNLEITITHDNGTSFQTISQENIYLNISKMSDGCRSKELIKFGLRFTPGMVGSKLRCGVKDSTNDFTLSEELSLIPRNICSCAVSESYRAHPSNCKVKVFCIEDGGIMYPTGVSCPSNECRNSTTGDCTTDCSNAVCEETVPSDFCTTPAPPTTTPAPSPYISCMDVSFSINSGAAVVTCSLNDTSTFTMMNVTYKKKGDSIVQHIAIIDNSNNVIMLAMQDHVNISIFDNIINITILDPSCENEGTFGIVTTINSENVEAQGQFSLKYPPGNATLTLSVDQVIDLGFYRDTGVHACTGMIGNPPQALILEILYANTTGYQEIPGSILKDFTRTTTTTSCQTFETIAFGLLFSTEMKDAKIRCRPSGKINNETLAEESLFLIPRDICLCGEPPNDDRGHPERCNVKILCLSENYVMFPRGILCPDVQCRNSITGECTADCSESVCNEDVPADFCITTDTPETTPIPPTPSVDVLCNGSSTEVNTGPVDIVCYFNQTIYDFINISFTMRNETISRPVADIQADGSVVMNDQTSNLVIQINVNVITIRTKIASCDFGGTYKVTVDTGGTPGFSSGTLEILTKPGKPSIDQQLHIVDGTKVKYTCSGNVGHPPGSIEFLVRKNGEENFTVSSIDLTSSEVLPNDNCNNEQTFHHEHTVTSDWNMTTIKCRAVNPRTITANDDMNLYISDEEEIVALSADYCSLPTKEYKPHPRGCVYYVRCVNSVIYSQQCGTGTCFSSANILSPCDFCRNVPPPCNATLS